MEKQAFALEIYKQENVYHVSHPLKVWREFEKEVDVWRYMKEISQRYAFNSIKCVGCSSAEEKGFKKTAELYNLESQISEAIDEKILSGEVFIKDPDERDKNS